MNRYRLFIGIGIAALVAGRLISPVVHAQDEDSESIRDQLRTMTKILEASIGNDSIDRRLARSSIFESRIRTEYIPTVGVIFTIPITFPLHPSEDEKGKGAEETVEEDLWEHFSRTSERASKAAVPDVPPIEPIEALKIQIDLKKERLDEQVDRIRTQAQQQLKAKMYAAASQDLLLWAAQGFSWDFSIGGSKPYDPVKVTKLTHTIIETIAQYGHRLESMPNSERVLVVLEAPRPRGSAVEVIQSENDENIAYTPVPRAREIVKEKKRVDERDPDERFVRVLRSVNSGTAGFFFRSKYDFPSERIYDHRLLAFKKGDLQQERSYDSIKSKVETTDY